MKQDRLIKGKIRIIIAIISAIAGVGVFFSSSSPISSAGLVYEVPTLYEISFLETKWLYFILLGGTLIWPIIASFIPIMRFRSYWKYLFLPAILWSSLYILWDIYFTAWGIWGFNTTHLSGYFFYGLPIEEILFFIIIPAACILLYRSVEVFITPRQSTLSDLLHIGFIIAMVVFGITFRDHIYSRWAVSMNLLSVSAFILLANSSFLKFFLTYFITLIPMFLVNGALTGMFSKSPVVIYNPDEFSGLRLISMPVEDMIYQYGLLCGFILLIEIQKKYKRSGTFLN